MDTVAQEPLSKHTKHSAPSILQGNSPMAITRSHLHLFIQRKTQHIASPLKHHLLSRIACMPSCICQTLAYQHDASAHAYACCSCSPARAERIRNPDDVRKCKHSKSLTSRCDCIQTLNHCSYLFSAATPPLLQHMLYHYLLHMWQLLPSAAPKSSTDLNRQR